MKDTRSQWSVVGGQDMRRIQRLNAPLEARKSQHAPTGACPRGSQDSLANRNRHVLLRPPRACLVGEGDSLATDTSTVLCVIHSAAKDQRCRS